MEQVRDHVVFQQMMVGYNRAKHSSTMIERACNGLEHHGGRLIWPLYEQYAVPVYVRFVAPPQKTITEACRKGAEKTRSVVDKAKSTAVTTATIGLGTAVVATQLSLALGVASASLVLDSIIFSKRVSGSLYRSGVDTEQAAQHRLTTLFYDSLTRTRALAGIPMIKLNEQANVLLDVSNALADRFLQLPTESEQVDAGIGQRVVCLGRRVSGAVQHRAHLVVLDPAQRSLRSLVDQLAKGLIVIDMVKSRRQWAMHKMDALSTPIAQFRARMDADASQYRVQPETLLLRSVRASSQALSHRLAALRLRSAQMLSPNYNDKLKSASDYIDRLDHNLGNSDSIYKVRDEVLSQAREKLTELAHWVSPNGWLVREPLNGHFY